MEGRLLDSVSKDHREPRVCPQKLFEVSAIDGLFDCRNGALRLHKYKFLDKQKMRHQSNFLDLGHFDHRLKQQAQKSDIKKLNLKNMPGIEGSRRPLPSKIKDSKRLKTSRILFFLISVSSLFA